MSTGKVKWFNTEKGYGFISHDGGKEIFVHFKDVEGGINGIKENLEYLKDEISGLLQQMYIDEWIGSHLEYSDQLRVAYILSSLKKFICV